MTANDSSQSVAPDEARIDIAIGSQAKVSPQLREALDSLAKIVEQQDDVQGYMKCDSVSWEGCAWLIKCSVVS